MPLVRVGCIGMVWHRYCVSFFLSHRFSLLFAFQQGVHVIQLFNDSTAYLCKAGDSKSSLAQQQRGNADCNQDGNRLQVENAGKNTDATVEILLGIGRTRHLAESSERHNEEANQVGEHRYQQDATQYSDVVIHICTCDVRPSGANQPRRFLRGLYWLGLASIFIPLCLLAGCSGYLDR